MKVTTSFLLLRFLTSVSADETVGGHPSDTFLTSRYQEPHLAIFHFPHSTLKKGIETTPSVRRQLKQSQPYVLQKILKDFEGSSTQHSWQCELQGADAKESGHFFVKLDGLDEKSFSDIRSGDYTLDTNGGEITTDGTLKLPAEGSMTLSKMSGRRGPADIARAHQGTNIEGDERRELQGIRSRAINYRRVLAVRVRASDSITTASEAVLSDKIFGTSGDRSNLKERFATCSYGETQIIPYSGRTATGVTVSNGVYTVTISNRASRVDEGIIRDAALAALTQSLGDIASQFDHVMLCLPPGTNEGWIGYGTYDMDFFIYCFRSACPHFFSCHLL